MGSFHKAVKKSVQKEDKKSKKARTKHEQQELKKKHEKAAEEYLDYVGQDSEEEGADATIEVQDEVQEQEKLAEFKKQEELERKRKFEDKEYIMELGKKLYDRAQRVDWPDGYTWRVEYKDERKISLIFKSKSGKWYGKGIKASMMPKYDLNAIHVLVTQCENTVDKLEGRLVSQNTSGLLGPDGMPYNA